MIYSRGRIRSKKYLPYIFQYYFSIKYRNSYTYFTVITDKYNYNFFIFFTKKDNRRSGRGAGDARELMPPMKSTIA